MRLRFFSAGSEALLRSVRDRACRGRRRTLPTIRFERVHRSSRRDPSWAARHNRRYRVARRYRALAMPPRHNRTPHESPRPWWDHRDYHGRFWLAVFKSCRGALAAGDTAAAPMGLYAGEHAGHGDLPRLEVEHLDHPWKVVPLSLISFQLARMSGLGPKRIAISNRLGLPVNLFDAMRVVLRRAIARGKDLCF